MSTTADSDAPLIPLAPEVRGFAAFAIALATFMQVLDSTIANVSLPTIAGGLGVSPNQGIWVITSFAVANGVSVPLTGWLMRRYGMVRTFVTCVALFTVASMLCGLAWSFGSLVAFRVLQGAVSGPMIPGSQALMLAIFPGSRRGTALALWSMTTLIAPVLGPVLGGYISYTYSWPWIFYINLPVGLLSASVCWAVLHRHELPTMKVPVDWIGLGLMVLWIGTFQIMLDTGKDLDWFASGRIVMLAIVTVVGLAAFLIWELTERNPIVDLALFRSRNFAIGTLTLCLGYMLFMGNLVLLPLWLQTQLGYTATWAGLVVAPAGVVAVLLSPLVGRMLGRVDARLLASSAFLAFAISMLLRGRLNAQAAYLDFVLPMLVQGVAMSTLFVAMVSIILDGLPPASVPSATGISNFLRITAGAFSASLSTTLWDDRAALHQTRLAEASSLYDPTLQEAIRQLEGLGIHGDAALGVLNRGLGQQSYLLSSLDYFHLSFVACFLLMFLVWMTHRPVLTHAPVAAD